MRDECSSRQDCVRICANKVNACVRLSTLLRNIRPQDTLQFTRGRDFNQLEGLAVAIPWGFESPLPQTNSRYEGSSLRAAILAIPTPAGLLNEAQPAFEFRDGAVLVLVVGVRAVDEVVRSALMTEFYRLETSR
jgi:hypothetical protein